LTDLDGSEHLSIVIDDVTIGAVLSAGVHNGSGSWTLTASELSGLTISPPANFSGDIALSVTAHSIEGSNGDNAASATISFNVHVDEPIAMQDMFIMSSLNDAAIFDLAVNQNDMD